MEPGNQEIIAKFVGKPIAKIEIKDSTLYVYPTDETMGILTLNDQFMGCCERRYMSTDDDLRYYQGSTLLGVDIADGPDMEDDDGEEHNTQFLNITTSQGVLTVVNHNEHNGYYGGFDLTAEQVNI